MSKFCSADSWFVPVSFWDTGFDIFLVAIFMQPVCIIAFVSDDAKGLAGKMIYQVLCIFDIMTWFDA